LITSPCVGTSGKTEGAPVIDERNPTYYNLFGPLEYRPYMVGMVTDFSMIKAGAFHRANGGFLVLQVLRFQVAYSTFTDLPGNGHPSQLPVLALPEAPEEGAPASPDEVAQLAARLKPWWTQHGGEWGSKSKALHFLFGEDVSAGGWHWQMTQAAIDRLNTSSTRNSTACNDLAGD
jgi:hypothetical protein